MVGEVHTERHHSDAEAARIRFERVTAELASEHRFGGPDAAQDLLEMMEEATRLVRQARRDRQAP